MASKPGLKIRQCMLQVVCGVLVVAEKLWMFSSGIRLLMIIYFCYMLDRIVGVMKKNRLSFLTVS